MLSCCWAWYNISACKMSHLCRVGILLGERRVSGRGKGRGDPDPGLLDSGWPAHQNQATARWPAATERASGWACGWPHSLGLTDWILHGLRPSIGHWAGHRAAGRTELRGLQTGAGWASAVVPRAHGVR